MFLVLSFKFCHQMAQKQIRSWLDASRLDGTKRQCETTSRPVLRLHFHISTAQQQPKRVTLNVATLNRICLNFYKTGAVPRDYQDTLNGHV